MRRAPTTLQIVSIFAIALGALGLCTVGMGLVQLTMGDRMSQMFVPNVPNNKAIRQQQEELQREIKAVTDEWATVNYTLFAVQFLVCGLLIVGGVQAWRMQPGGERLLPIAFLLVIGFELARVYPQIGIQKSMSQVMERYMIKSMQTGPGGRPAPPAAARIMSGSMKFGQVLGYVMMGGWLLLKVSFYGYGIYYLRRAETRQLFEPAEEMDWTEEDATEAEQSDA